MAHAIREPHVEISELGDLVSARASGDPETCRRAEDAVMVQFLSVSAAIARRYQHRGVDVDDLEQVARLGLVKAVRRWRADRGPFLPYAVPTIEGEVKRYFRDNGSTIRIPRILYESQPKVMAARKQLWQESAREPAAADIADRAGLPIQQVRAVQAAAVGCRPLSTDEASTFDQLPSAEAEHDLSSVDLRTRLRPALEALTERERTIIVLRFVWDQSQAQIATAIGVSQMQVSRLLRAALAKMRERVADGEGTAGDPAGVAAPAPASGASVKDGDFGH